MSDRVRVPTAAPWAGRVGYSRAVRVGETVYVSGTVAVDDEGRIGPPDDPYGQARRCLQIIADALAEAGASISDVVRTRMFVLDPEQWVEVGRAHGEVFGETKPATTLVAVAGLVDPEALVEIEAVAVVG
jgi:enamine deaminase RidA (YjgF/YER057c/UK114 family)